MVELPPRVRSPCQVVDTSNSSPTSSPSVVIQQGRVIFSDGSIVIRNVYAEPIQKAPVSQTRFNVGDKVFFLCNRYGTALSGPWKIVICGTAFRGQGQDFLPGQPGASSKRVCLLSAEGCDRIVSECSEISPVGYWVEETLLSKLRITIVYKTPETSHGKCDGTLQVQGDGGAAPYYYSISPSGAPPQMPNLPQGRFTGLAAGSWILTVMDSYGYWARAKVHIRTASSPLNLSAPNSAEGSPIRNTPIAFVPLSGPTSTQLSSL